MNSSKPKLTLPKSGDSPTEDNELRIDIGVFDVLLPCRQFWIEHKVAELSRFSMTMEFLLRLLHSADGISETDIGRFFGFDIGELNYIISEAEEFGYAERKGGRVWLTQAGEALFKDDTDEPQIYSVEKRTFHAGFDLLSLAPAERESLSLFEVRLPELQVEDIKRVSSARKEIPKAFRRFYGEFRTRHQADPTKRRFLYSVDDVRPGDRFSSAVRIIASSKVNAPGFPEPDLSSWKVGYELEDRNEIVERSAAFLENIRIMRRPEDNFAHDILQNIAPEFIEPYMRGGSLNVERLFKEAIERVGEFRADRQTIPIVGSLFTEKNVSRLFEALEYSTRRRRDRPKMSVWLVPNVPAWGATRVLPSILERLEKIIESGEEGQSAGVSLRNIAVSVADPERHISSAFDMVVPVRSEDYISPLVEIVVVPGLVAATLVHAPMKAAYSAPVPIGILTFDKDYVVRAEQKLRSFSLNGHIKTGRRFDFDPDTFLKDFLRA